MNRSQPYLIAALVCYSIVSTGVIGYLWGSRTAPVEQAQRTQAAAKPSQIQAPVKSAINWNKYDDGLKLAKRKHKPIYIQAHANWCPYCKRMESEVYPQTSVKNKIHKEFIPVRLVDKSTTKIMYQGQEVTETELIKKLGVTGFPTHIFLDAEGNLLEKRSGYVDADTLNAMLEAIKTGKKS